MKIWIEGTEPPCDKCAYGEDKEACLASDCYVDYDNNKCSYYQFESVSSQKPLSYYYRMLDAKRKQPKLFPSYRSWYCIARKQYREHKLVAGTKEKAIEKWKKFQKDVEYGRLRSGKYVRELEDGSYDVRYKDTKRSCNTKKEAVDFCKSLIRYFYR